MIYTFGYSKRSVEDVQRIVGDDGLLFDIRLSPRSRRAGFSQKALEKVFGDRYNWLYEFGNENFTGGDVQLYDPDAGVAIIAEIAQEHVGDIFLMCLCGDPDKCHRKQVRQLLTDAGLEAKEL
jgi:uncharacterized protein (DUF488 family)